MKKVAVVLVLLLLIALICSCGDEGDESASDGDQDSTGDQDLSETDGDSGESVTPEDGDDASIDGDEERFEVDEEMEGEGEQPWSLPYTSPEQSGSYRIGAMSALFVDPEQERELSGTVWYPTEASEGEAYIYQTILKREHVFKEAPPAKGGPFPVIVFSHGNQSFAEQSYYMSEFMTGHGFIFAACDHIGNTTGTHDKDLAAYIAQQRPKDLGLVIDLLEQWNEDAEHALYGKIDLDRVAAIGHSYGGFTVLAAGGATVNEQHLRDTCGPDGPVEKPIFCDLLGGTELDLIDYDAVLSDSRIKVIVPQAAAGYDFFFTDGLADIKMPVLIQVGDKDLTVPHDHESLQIYDVIADPKYMMLLKDGGHFTFSNMCEVIPGFGDGCGEGFIDAARAFYLTNLYALAFLRYHLLGEERDTVFLGQEYSASFDDVDWSFSVEDE